MKLVRCSIFGVACMVALLACNKSGPDREGKQIRDFDDKSGAPLPGERVGVTTVSGADLGSLSSELAVERIVAARCARETACKDVGSDKHFVDPDVCAREVRSRAGADLRASECAYGIASSALDECMEAIRSESCSNAVESIQRLAACRTGRLCPSSSQPTR